MRRAGRIRSSARHTALVAATLFACWLLGGCDDGNSADDAPGGRGRLILGAGLIRVCIGDQRGDHASEARKGPHEQPEQRDAERRSRQFAFAEPGYKDHIDRMDEHLQQVCQRQRPGQPKSRADLVTPTVAA